MTFKHLDGVLLSQTKTSLPPLQDVTLVRQQTERKKIQAANSINAFLPKATSVLCLLKRNRLKYDLSLKTITKATVWNIT